MSFIKKFENFESEEEFGDRKTKFGSFINPEGDFEDEYFEDEDEEYDPYSYEGCGCCPVCTGEIDCECGCTECNYPGDFEEDKNLQEKKGNKWIKDAIKKPGSLRKSLHKKKGEKISNIEIDSELQALKGKDKDKSKKGVQGLSKNDLAKYRKLNLAKTLKGLKEHQDTQNYMFFGNLQTIKRLVDEMLEMDESKIDEILKEHNWALDHIATSKDDVEEVFNFLAGHNSPEEKPLLGGPESSHTVHDNHMRSMVNSETSQEEVEDDEMKNLKSFGNFK